MPDIRDMYDDEVFQRMLPQEQIKVLKDRAKQDPDLSRMSESELMKLHASYSSEAQAKRLAPKGAGVDFQPLSESDIRSDKWQRMQETASPADVFKGLTAQIGRIPVVGDLVQEGVEGVGEGLTRGAGMVVGGLAPVAEAITEAIGGVPLPDTELRWEGPGGLREQLEMVITASPEEKREYERGLRQRRIERRFGPEGEELERAAIETARPFVETGQKISEYGERMGPDARVRRSFQDVKEAEGVWDTIQEGSHLVAQTGGNIVGYAIPYLLSPSKYRNLYLGLTGAGEISERAWEETGSTQPEYTLPAAVVYATVEKLFGPERWARAATAQVKSTAAKKFINTFLRDPNRRRGFATWVVKTFGEAGLESLTEGGQEYIISQAAHSDEPELTLDDWNTLPDSDKEAIVNAMGATFLTLGAVGGVRNYVSREKPVLPDTGVRGPQETEVFFDRPQTNDDLRAAQPVASAYLDKSRKFPANPEQQVRYQEAADSVRIVEPSDPYTMEAVMLAMRNGLNVQFFTDSMGRDAETGRTAPGIRSVIVDENNVLVRVDPNNPRAAAGEIVKLIVSMQTLEDPSRLQSVADILKSKNPQLWEAARTVAKEQNIDDDLGTLAVAAEMSAPDIITQLTADPNILIQAREGGTGGEIFPNMSRAANRLGRKFISNFINPRIPVNLQPGSLRYAIADMNNLPLIGRDIEGRSRLAETAKMLTDEVFPYGGSRVLLSSSINQPIIFERSVEGGPSDVGPRFTTERGTMLSSMVDWMFRKLADDRTMMREVQDEIERKGFVLTDDVNMVQAMETKNSRTANTARKFKDIILERVRSTIVEGLNPKEYSAEFDRLGNFFLAVIALDRNRYLRENPETADESGMSDEEANDIIRAVEASGRLETYQKALDIALEAPRITLAALLDSGLITPEAYARMRAAHPRYLPMKSPALTDAVGDARLVEDELGRPVEVNATSLLHRLSGSKARREFENPLRQVFMDAIQRFDMAERNKTMQTIYRFAQKYGGNFMRAEQGSVSRTDSDLRRRQLAVYFDGQPHRITFESEGVRDQFANLSNKQIPVVLRLFRPLTNLKARAATTFSIPFWFVNFPRDLVTAYYQSDSQEMGINTIKNTPLAFRSILAVEFPDQFSPDEITPELQKGINRYEMFRDEGGQLSFMGLREMYRDLNKLAFQLGDNKSTAFYRVRQFIDLMDNMSSVLENTTRLAAFNAAIDDGATPRAAAHYARNITVDFDRKTDAGRAMNSMFVFANANIQGTTRIVRAMWQNPHSRKTLMQFGMMGFVAALLSRANNPEDWEKISEDAKARNIIFLNKDGTYNSLPLPPGLAFFFRMGSFAEEIAFSDKPKDPMTEALKPLGMILDEFSPVAPSRVDGSGFGGTGYSWGRMFFPSGAQEFFDIHNNMSVWGSEIYPEPGKYDRRRPETNLYFGDPKSSYYRQYFSMPVTDFINRAFGGNPEWKGEFADIEADISPESLEYVLESFLSGPLAFTNRAWKASKHFANVAAGKDVPPLHENMVPVVRRFHNRATDYEIGDQYYSIRDDVRQAKNLVKAYQEGELSASDYETWADRNGWLLQLEDDIKKTEAELTELRNNRTESSYRADSERRHELQRAVVEKRDLLWLREENPEPPQPSGRRFYDETAVRVARDQMGMLEEMMKGYASGGIPKEAYDKYMSVHGWKKQLLPAYRKMQKAMWEIDSPSQREVIQYRFLDDWYELSEKNAAAEAAAE